MSYVNENSDTSTGPLPIPLEVILKTDVVRILLNSRPGRWVCLLFLESLELTYSSLFDRRPSL